ncbi:hypothetical protein IT414_02330 [bacterium]|nr:hypothetical protein [bacterium]
MDIKKVPASNNTPASAKPAPTPQKSAAPVVKPAGKATITVGAALSTAKDGNAKTAPKQNTQPTSDAQTLAAEVPKMPSANRNKVTASLAAVPPLPAPTPKPAATPQSNTMPHKSHLGIGIAAAIVVLGMVTAGIFLVTGGLKNPATRTIQPKVDPGAQYYTEADTELQQLDADLKDAADRFNDQAGDLTEN